MAMMRKMALMKAMAGPMSSEEDLPQEEFEVSEKPEAYSFGDGKRRNAGKREMRIANRRMRRKQKMGQCYSGDKCFTKN